MYRLVVCLNYLRSRFLTLLSIGAVLLGVGTLVVVLAVMGGFAKQVREAIRGGLSDVIIEGDVGGFPYYDQFATRIRQHPNVVEAAPVVQLYGLVKVTGDQNSGVYVGGSLNRWCVIYGIRPEQMAAATRFSDYLERQKNFAKPSFEVPPYVVEAARSNPLLEPESEERTRVLPGCIPGRELVSYEPIGQGRQPKAAAERRSWWARVFSSGAKPEEENKSRSALLSSVGAKLVLMTPEISAGGSIGTFSSMPRFTMRAFTVVDHYKSKLYEFDSKFIFIPFEKAQDLGGLTDPTGETPPKAHQILVRLRDYSQAKATMDDLRELWAEVAREDLRLQSSLNFSTWEERQATILSAVEMERVLMIIMLGFIVLVAGFMIGAMLAMIVKEKTRDIGILKSLGASNFGVAQIFLYYGALVGVVGALLGLAAGLGFIANIDAIERWLSGVLGVTVFDRHIYYFDRIPRVVDHLETALVVAGAILWTVLCSTVAAYRAARMRPVEALRHE